MKAQCVCHFAPCSIHWRTTSICLRCCVRGRTRRAASAALCPRAEALIDSRLFAGSPGTISVPFFVSRERAFLRVEPHSGHPVLFIGTVALEAVFREDGADIAIEIDLRQGGERCR